jgi:hypothetical protein
MSESPTHSPTSVLPHFRLKHLLLAVLWIGANCAVLRIIFTSGLSWFDFPFELVVVNLAA